MATLAASMSTLEGRRHARLDSVHMWSKHSQNIYHHVYMDNYFKSFKLLEDLEEDGIYACGTARKDRKGFPVDLKNPGLKNRYANLVHTHSRMHARTHTRTYARTHAQASTHAGKHTHTQAHTRTHTHAHTT